MRFTLALSWMMVTALFVSGIAPLVAQERIGPAKDQNGERKATVAVVTIKGMLPESSQQTGLLGEIQTSLSDIVSRLDKAAQDKDVSAVLLRIRGPQIGRGKLEELRAAILRVRQAGKKVIADITDGAATDYLLAAACEEIVMPESGTLMILGVRAEVTYYKGLFDKLGVHADMLQVGDFKGAAEPYLRKEMSPAFRKQYEALVDDVFEQMVASISANRKLPAERVRELIDIGLFTAPRAKELRLIDTVAYGDQIADGLKTRLGVDKVELVEDYGKKKVDADFSGMLGMVRLFELMMGAEPTKRSSSNKKIAVIYATGPIMTGESSADLLGEHTVGSDTIVRAIRRAATDKTVQAVVLRVDSPGGSALASDLIWREIDRLEKPIVASMGDVAASGGYYISMGCDRVFAEPGTITGSIGVVGGKVALGGLMDKVGVSTDVISRGKNSGLLSMNQPFTPSEREAWQGTMNEIYRQFTAKAAAGRKLDAAKLETLAGGRVWTGRQAKANGLVDELGTLRDALQAAKKLAGMPTEEKAELLVLPEPKSFFDQLLSGNAAATGVGQRIAEAAPAMSRELRQVYQLERLFREPAVLVMPYPVSLQ